MPLVLVTALLLVGLFGASVLAQSSKEGKRGLDSEAGTAGELHQVIDITKVNKEKLTLYLDPNEGADGISATNVLATVMIEAVANPDGDPETEDARPGLDATPDDGKTAGLTATHNTPGDNSQELTAYELVGPDAGKFNITAGAITVDGDALEDFKAHNKQAVYNFSVKIYVDTDTDADTGKGAGAPADSTALQNTPLANGTTPRPNDLTDDRDAVETLAVTVHALKITTDRFAYATTRQAVSDAPLMGLDSEGRGYSHGLSIAGLPNRSDVRAGAETAGGTEWTLDIDKGKSGILRLSTIMSQP